MDQPLNYNPLTTPAPSYPKDMANFMKALWLRLNTASPQPVVNTNNLPGAQPLLGPDMPPNMPDIPSPIPTPAPPQQPDMSQLMTLLNQNAPQGSLSASYGPREDGTQKGNGYFGPLQRPDGNLSTELSIGVNLGGKEMDIPSIVPSLTREQLANLLSGGEMTPDIVKTAVDFAKKRLAAGKSVWADPSERYPLPEK